MNIQADMNIQKCFVILTFIMFAGFGCSKRPEKGYYRNMNLCYSNLKAVYSELALDMIHVGTESNVLKIAEANKKYQSFKCPVTDMRYAINPDRLKWRELQSTNVAIACIVIHPETPVNDQYYLTISFEGRLSKVYVLPSWAQKKREPAVKTIRVQEVENAN